ncbi:cytosolic leucyl tRNA synthetase [Blyttiomyces sp. JEL0837]|nr:cytosolic leucyl tRNA synthetase [Blyttiomyces sp. JEL0837]
MHKDLVIRFIELQALLMAPITPHWSEYLWSELLKKPTSVQKALWPKYSKPVDNGILAAAQYVRDLVYRTRAAEDAAQRKKAKGKKGAVPETTDGGPRTLRLYYAASFPDWQEACLAALKTTWDASTNSFTGKEREALTAAGLISDKRAMPFAAMMKKSIETLGGAGFDRRLAFDEKDTLVQNSDYIRRELIAFKIEKVEFVAKEEVVAGNGGFTEEDVLKAEQAVPGVPTYRFT